MLTKQRKLRKTRVRAKIAGTASAPRVAIFRSNKYIYAQAINDEKGVTVAHAKDADPKKAGKSLAVQLKKIKLTKVVFDRAGYKYHGKVQKLAESLREENIEF